VDFLQFKVMNHKGFAANIILLIGAGILIVGGLWYYEGHRSVRSQTPHDVEQSGSTSTNVANSESSSITAASTFDARVSLSTAVTTTGIVSAPSTSSWLKYDDPQDGFSFQYPPDCLLDTSTYSNAEEEVIVPQGTTADACSIDLLAIRIYHKSASQPLFDYWRTATNLTVISSTNLMVSGYAAIIIEGREPPLQSGEGRTGGHVRPVACER